MAKVTKNFSLEEIQHSDTAERRGITNVVPIGAHGVMYKLFKDLMQPLRDKTGSIKLTSGFRCQELNDIIGGSPFSQHIYSNKRGAACDFVHYRGKLSTVDMINIILMLNLPFDQLILEYPKSHTGGWLHVSVGGIDCNIDEYRHQILVKERGKPYISVDPFEDNMWKVKYEE